MPQYNSLPFDHPMIKPMEEVNIKKFQMNKYDDSIHILDSNMINLDEKDTLNDDLINTNSDIYATYFNYMYETINIGHDLSVILSQ